VKVFGGNMPNYTIKNITTKEQYQVDCSYSELQEMLKNSELVQGLSSPLLVGGVKDMFGKTPDGFKDLMKRTKKGSGIGNTIKT